MLSKLLKFLAFSFLAFALLGVVAAGALYLHLAPGLPPTDSLKDARLQTPLRVYSRDGKLISEFGEYRRLPLGLAAVPNRMIQAVLAAEDERFFEHPGVDWQGLTRAALHVIKTGGEKGPGGSTITMQVARNFFLSREKTYTRKLNEILLSLQIERSMSKNAILELYLNKIFLGNRAYGVGAAAQVYYGKPLAELSLAQTAMIAGLPKAPSRFNPLVAPARALARRDYVLGNMLNNGFITAEEHAEATSEPVSATLHGQSSEVEAPYLAEMVRSFMEERFGEEAYLAGFKVYTTINPDLQVAANASLRHQLERYDRRHGYRGPERSLGEAVTAEEAARVLRKTPEIGNLEPAVVLEILTDGESGSGKAGAAKLLARTSGEVVLPFEGVSWARPYENKNRRGAAPRRIGDVLAVGDLIRIYRHVETEEEARARKKKKRSLPDSPWRMGQIPAVSGALVSLDPKDGGVLALIGGYDFYHSKFNRAVQAERQPGSSFKPFIYSAALDFGFNAASIINDAPIVFDDPGLEDAWRPENYSGKFYGPTRMREALYRSRNLVSIRLMRRMGIDYVVDYVTRFGFERDRLPANLSLSLGSGTVTPIELATAYASLANGGYRVENYFIERIEETSGKITYVADPLTVCATCKPSASFDASIPDAGSPENPDAAKPQRLPPQTGAETAPSGSEPAVQTAALGMPTVLNGFNLVPSDAPAPVGQVRAAPRVLSPATAWLIGSMLRDVVRRGTAARASVLKRKDLAGKTGTTNDQRDAWFSGFNPELVATVWVGFDDYTELGRGETGSKAALPIWIDFMRTAIETFPETVPDPPPGIVTARVNKKTGQPTGAGDPDAVFEYFHAGRAPGRSASSDSTGGGQTVRAAPGRLRDKLF